VCRFVENSAILSIEISNYSIPDSIYITNISRIKTTISLTSIYTLHCR